MTFGSNAGTTQIDRDAASEGVGNNTVLSVGAGGITVASGAGAVTFGSLATDRNQRVTVGVLEDLTVANNSSNDLTFNRDFDGRGTARRTVTVAGSGAGDTIFKQILYIDANRDLAMTINKTAGTGVVRFDGTNTYRGATTVTAGTLLVNGSTVAASAFSVGANGILGGTGTIGGTVSFASGAKFFFDPASALTVTGAVTFDNSFGVSSLIVDDWSLIGNDTYTLINSGSDFSNISNWGVGNAATLDDGRQAYFKEGSLQLVVIPEPSTLILLGISLATLAAFRRRK